MKLLVLAATLAGVLVALRSATDARLGRALPDPMFAVIATGALAALTGLVFVLARGASLPSAYSLFDVPSWMWIGGIAGGASYALLILLTPRLGVATVSAWVTAGQTAFSLAADHYGWFGLEVTQLTWLRLFGDRSGKLDGFEGLRWNDGTPGGGGRYSSNGEDMRDPLAPEQSGTTLDSLTAAELIVPIAAGPRQHGKLIPMLGWAATAGSVSMYFAYIDQIALNLEGSKGSVLQPAAALVASTLWALYGGLRAQRDWPIVCANIPGIVLSAVAMVTAL